MAARTSAGLAAPKRMCRRVEAGVAAPAPKGAGTSTTDGGMRLPSRSDASCCSLSPGPARPQRRSRPTPGHSGSTPPPPRLPSAERPWHGTAAGIEQGSRWPGQAAARRSGPARTSRPEKTIFAEKRAAAATIHPTTSPNRPQRPSNPRALFFGQWVVTRRAETRAAGLGRSAAEIGPRCARSAQPPTFFRAFPLAPSFRLCSHHETPRTQLPMRAWLTPPCPQACPCSA